MRHLYVQLKYTTPHLPPLINCIKIYSHAMLKHENNSINKAWIKYIIRLSFHITNYIEQSIGTITHQPTSNMIWVMPFALIGNPYNRNSFYFLPPLNLHLQERIIFGVMLAYIKMCVCLSGTILAWESLQWELKNSAHTNSIERMCLLEKGIISLLNYAKIRIWRSVMQSSERQRFFRKSFISVVGLVEIQIH